MGLSPLYTPRWDTLLELFSLEEIRENLLTWIKIKIGLIRIQDYVLQRHTYIFC